MGWLASATLLLAVGWGAVSAWRANSIPGDRLGAVIRGTVVNDSRPVAGARVRVKGQSAMVLTDAAGRFELPRPTTDSAVTVTASKDGHFIAGVAISDEPLKIQLHALPSEDNADYAWVDPTPKPEATHNCGNCHGQIYREWKSSGHAASATNRRFQNLVSGHDWHGRSRHGWSLAAEHPEGVAVCSSCHTPTLALDDPGLRDPAKLTGVAAEGVHCDYCHKIADVSLDQLGLNHGRFAQALLRPTEKQLFFGPLDDVDRGEDVHSPLQSESRYCAACHEGTVFGVPVYTTYTEWLSSPARREGKQCQTCHMTPSGQLTNIAPGAGGIERDPKTLASHTFLPGGRQAMLERSLKLSATHTPSADSVAFDITLVAQNVGHAVPTGFIDRHLLLVLDPLDANGKSLVALEGPQLPPAVGESLAGRAGQLYGRLLTDLDGQSPAPFWRAGVQERDTRLEPDEPVRTRFLLPAKTHRVHVRLIYRRFWQSVARAKDWPNDEIIVVDRLFPVAAGIEK